MKKDSPYLSGGVRAVRPWGGLWSRERTHPGASRPLSLRATPPKEGIFLGMAALTAVVPRIKVPAFPL